MEERKPSSNQNAFLGGTFTTLHSGHIALLTRAAKYGKITIGLTSDAFARKMKIHPCEKYVVRLAALRSALKKLGALSRSNIVEINDAYGPAVLHPRAATLVLSSETASAAAKINGIRAKKRLPILSVDVVPMLHAEDGIRISSTRILSGKISRSGACTSSLYFAIGSKNPTKIAGVKSAARRAFPRAKFRFAHYEIKGHAPEQPIGYEATWKGAMERAKRAYEKANFSSKNICDYGVGLESGLIRLGSRTFDVQFCCLYDGFEYSAGSSMGFPLPQSVVEEIDGGNQSLGDVVSRVSGIRNIGAKGGALAFLSRGLLHRKEMVEQAFLCALVERFSPV